MQASRSLAQDILHKNLNRLKTSIDYKRARFAKIKDAQDMMLGKVKPKLRQQFNVPLPVLSGMFDTLCADLDDPIQIKVKNNPGKNLLAVKGINEAISIDKKSLKVSARWDYKDRISRKYAIGYGRGILKGFSASSPHRFTLEATDPELFHCQPRGGGLLERHLFVGEEGIVKTKYQLTDGVNEGIYDKQGVELISERISDKEYQDKLSSLQDDQMRRFQALNLDPNANNYVGEPTTNLVEMVSTDYGERWYMLFDPWNKAWIRFEKYIDIQPSGLLPWTSYATHEDDKNFWSLSILADVLYPIADSICTMFNQELTNRQKRNLNAKAYDRDVFKNVAKLDEAQYRPDALVPADTLGGTRRIGDALYAFETPELTGTIDLVTWLTDFTGKQTGIYQDAKPMGGRNKTNNVVFAEIQQLAKRTDYRSHSYTEAWGEMTMRYIDSLRTMTAQEAIDMLGMELGYGFKKQLKEIKFDNDDIQIISTKQQNQEDAMRKQQKTKSLEMVLGNPLLTQRSNPDWLLRHAYSDIGGWEEEEIEEATDLRGMGSERTQLAEADQAMQDLIKGREPAMCWSATTVFQRKILDFASAHRIALKDKFPKFIDYVRSHNQIVAENMAQLAIRQRAANQQQAALGGGQPQQGQSGQGGGTPLASTGGNVAPQPSMQRGQPTPAVVNMQ